MKNEDLTPYVFPNEKLGVELGKNGRQYVLENHDISVIADQYIKVFERQPSF